MTSIRTGDPRSPDSRIPVTLVTGFLGSGKTTLINEVLRDADFAGTLVIVNEFGEIGLDNALIANAQDDVVLLESGCLCCAASGTLRDTLIDIFSRGVSSALPPIRHIIVETSGLANPAPLVATLIGDSAIKPRCRLEQVLTLVDPLNVLDNLENYAEAQQQIAFADTLVITKTDQVSEERLTFVSQGLDPINDKAPRQYWHPGQAAVQVFRAPGASVHRGPDDPEAWIQLLMKSSAGSSPSFTSSKEAASRSGPMRVHGASFSNISTCTLEFASGPLDWQAYANLTGALSSQYKRQLLRCKGVLALGPEAEIHIIQGVQGYFAPPEKRPFGIPMDRRPFLICIMDGVTSTELVDFVGTVPGIHLSNHPKGLQQ